MKNLYFFILSIIIPAQLYSIEKKPTKPKQTIQKYNAKLFELLQAAGQTKQNETIKSLSPADATQGLQTITTMLTQLKSIYKATNITKLTQNITAEKQKLTTNTQKLQASKTKSTKKRNKKIEQFKKTEHNYWNQLKNNMSNMLIKLKQTKAKNAALAIVPETGWWNKTIDFKEMAQKKISELEEKNKQLFNLFTKAMNSEQQEKDAKEAELKQKQLEEQLSKVKEETKHKEIQTKLLAELNQQIHTITADIATKTKDIQTYQTNITALLNAAKLPANTDIKNLQQELRPIANFIDTMQTTFQIDNSREIATEIKAIPNPSQLTTEIAQLKTEINIEKIAVEKNKEIGKQIFDLQVDAHILLQYQTQDLAERRKNARKFTPRENRIKIKNILSAEGKTQQEVNRNIQEIIIDLEKKAQEGPLGSIIKKAEDLPLAEPGFMNWLRESTSKEPKEPKYPFTGK